MDPGEPPLLTVATADRQTADIGGAHSVAGENAALSAKSGNRVLSVRFEQVSNKHPRSPWQRGTNENTDGLLRQYFPKGTDISTSADIPRRELDAVAAALNSRPLAKCYAA